MRNWGTRRFDFTDLNIGPLSEILDPTMNLRTVDDRYSAFYNATDEIQLADASPVHMANTQNLLEALAPDDADYYLEAV